MVEYTIDTMEKKSTKRILSYIRKTTYERLKKEHIVIAPGALYAWLYKQYAEIEAEEITDIDDTANTKDKMSLHFWHGNFTQMTMPFGRRRKTTMLCH